MNRKADAAGSVWKSSYDGLGNLIQKTDFAGRVTSYTYDANGNRVTKTTPWASVTYSYNALDQLTQAGNKTLSFDPNGNLVGETLGTQSST